MRTAMACRIVREGLGAAALLAVLAAGCGARGAPGEVRVTVTKNGFKPWRIPARKGAPLVLVVTRTTDQTCATELVIPEAGVNAPLPLGEPVRVTLTPAREGELRFSCAMKMFGGVIDVM
jgi:plastocyanin domain-containing protein